MDELFSQEFFFNNSSLLFTVYRVSENLFQAKSPLETIMLWKTGELWEGVSNLEESPYIQQIGKAIDSHLQTKTTRH